MITFRRKNESSVDLVPKAIEDLKREGLSYEVIKSREASIAAGKNAKAMVLVEFKETEDGYYELKLMDKSMYSYTQKLLKDIFQMRITNIDSKTKTITAQVDHLGVALDIIEALSLKYNLSIVYDGNI